MPKTSYNVRVIDNGNGTYSLGYVHRYKRTPKSKTCHGSWVRGSRKELVQALKGTFSDHQ